MRVTASARAAEVVAEMATRRSGTLTVTIGTGCCESTAPFLYEDMFIGPEQEVVGEVAFATGVRLHELSPVTASLESAYLELTGDEVEYRAVAR